MASADIETCPRAAWLFATAQQFQVAAGDFLTYYGTLDGFLKELAARLTPPSSPVESLILRGLLAEASRKLWAPRQRELPRITLTAVEKAAALLRSEYAKHWTLDAIGHSVGRHKTLLTTEFRRAYDCSIHKFLTDIRIDAAKRLLVETNWKTEAIALAVGYSSRTTFHRQFCRAGDVTPAEFRRRQSSFETAQKFAELTQA